MSKAVKKAKEKMDSFSARGSLCPLCGKDFRNGCSHSVKQARDKLLENYIRAVSSN